MNQKFKIYVPNMITCIRIVLSIFLFIIEPQTIIFWVIYIICGVTDVCDGYLARRWSVSSKKGARLDSIADLLFITALLYCFIPNLALEKWMIIWILIIAVIRCLSILVGMLKYHTLAFLHTYGNKVTGLLIFCFPVLLKVAGLKITVIAICAVATISAIEELVIMISSISLDRDRKGR